MNIPNFLPDRFLNWRLIDGRKVPCLANGEVCDAHDPNNHTDYATAATAPFGVAFDVRAEDGLYFLDLDKCGGPDGWTPEAQAIWQSFSGAWGEVSQSGQGLHIMGRCDPSKLKDRRNKFDGWKELYTDGRFVAFGPHGWQSIGGTATNQDWTQQLLRLVPQREFLGELPEGIDPAYTGPADDAELITMMLRATGGAGAAFGMRATVADLWRADAAVLRRFWPRGDGYDHSSADAALMTHLAFWTGKDMRRMDRLFRQSGLIRDKYRDRPDYRTATVQAAARLCKKVYDHPKHPESATAVLVEAESKFYSAASLAGKPVKTREWLVPDLVPRNTVTLFSGDGGTGKSLLAFQLAVAVVTGTPWIGNQVQGGGVIMVSAEDDNQELHRRLDDILEAGKLDYAACTSLTLRSLAGEDALLAVEGANALLPSPLFEELESLAKKEQPNLIVIDTLADVNPSNENDRAKARQFISILSGLAIRQKCAVLLLAHPSLSGMSTGTGTSGSTAWSNSVRSRLFLERVIQDGYEANPDARLLSVKKANYGRTGGEISLLWRDGVLVAEGAGPSITGVKAEMVFLFLLRRFTEQGRRVNPRSGANYAPSQFALHPDSQNISKRALRVAMEKLLSSGQIEVAEEGPPSKRVKYLKIVESLQLQG